MKRLVCPPVGSVPAELLPETTVERPCVMCGAACLLSPSSREQLSDPGAQVWCLTCATTSKVAVEETPPDEATQRQRQAEANDLDLRYVIAVEGLPPWA